MIPLMEMLLLATNFFDKNLDHMNRTLTLTLDFEILCKDHGSSHSDRGNR